MNRSHVSDLTGLGALPQLKWLYANNMEVPLDLDGIQGSSSLLVLQANSSGIREVDPLAGLTTLTTLQIPNNQIIDASALAPIVPTLSTFTISGQERWMDPVDRCEVFTLPDVIAPNGTPLSPLGSTLEQTTGGHRFRVAGNQAVSFSGSPFDVVLYWAVAPNGTEPCDGWPPYASVPTLAATGTVGVGRPLTATFTGDWSPTPDSVELQWYRVSANGALTELLETGSTYTPNAQDRGLAFIVRATATEANHGPSVVTSPATLSLLSTPPTVAITGTVAIGTPITARLTGNWTPAPTLTYRWQRVAPNGTATPIPGATTATYTPTAADRGRALRVSVTATRSGYAGETVTSARTLRFFAQAPTPKLSGKAKVGKTLTAQPGTWSPSATLTYRWFASGKAIKGASSPTLTLTKKHAGKRITVRVTASRPGTVSESRTSAPTKPVT
jgi:hypothetical protein